MAYKREFRTHWDRDGKALCGATGKIYIDLTLKPYGVTCTRCSSMRERKQRSVMAKLCDTVSCALMRSEYKKCSREGCRCCCHRQVRP